MGMYTEFHFNSRLKENTPAEVLEALQWMLAEDKPDVPPALPSHPLFQGKLRCKWMLLSDSYYFDALTRSELEFDDIANQYFLSIRCNLKNYDNEIQKFVDWIRPYLDQEDGAFLGFHRYEETEQPTLLFY